MTHFRDRAQERLGLSDGQAARLERSLSGRPDGEYDVDGGTARVKDGRAVTIVTGNDFPSRDLPKAGKIKGKV